MKTAVVAGAIAGKQGNGGEAWVRLSWIRAFERLGFRVYFAEQVETPTAGQIAYFSEIVDDFGLTGRACLIDPTTGKTTGMALEEMRDAAGSAEFLVNISGNLGYPPVFDRFGLRIYVDLDPGFTQYWHRQGLLGEGLERHHIHLTVGSNVGGAQCPIPTGGIRWRPIRQPVVLEDWPFMPSPSLGRMTTIGSLRGPFGPVTDNGAVLGLKIHEMRKFAGMASEVDPVLELAMHIDPADERDRLLLEEGGWRLVAPGKVAGDPGRFREYIQGSDGEFSVAQGIYVDTASGWFSDRSVRYLASGKPVLVQDTGVGENLPVGDGLLVFSDEREAKAGLAKIADRYQEHCRAARAIAEDFFEAGRVAGDVLVAAGGGH
ncbi:MAG: glycosyltransferase [Actinomycetota bacterium]